MGRSLFLVRLDGDDTSEVLCDGVTAAEALAWTEEWLTDHLGLSVLIQPVLGGEVCCCKGNAPIAES